MRGPLSTLDRCEPRHTCSLDSLLVCPKCNGPLADTDGREAKKCLSCKLTFPVYFGVPDFRLNNKGSTPPAEQGILTKKVLAAYPNANFEELIAIRYPDTKVQASRLAQRQKSHELNYQHKGNVRYLQIKSLFSRYDRSIGQKNLFLDLGCGSGTAVPWIMRDFDAGVGVDYSLADLLIGSKFLKERGIKNLKLICADVRYLPLPAATFDFANSLDLIEHIPSGQALFLSETYRVLKFGGALYLNSPNRFNVFTPEPHVKIRFLGFIPRPWMERYVQLRTGLPYRNYNLLSISELKDLLRHTFGYNYHISGPFLHRGLSHNNLKRNILTACPFLLDVLNKTFFTFTTNYHVLAFKVAKGPTACTTRPI